MTFQMKKQALLVISEQGLQSLMLAGISIGWLKAWMLMAGAEDVSIEWLESNRWRDSDADAQLFFASDDDLHLVMQQHGFDGMPDGACFRLGNPPRRCCSYDYKGHRIVLLALGDIAFQRHAWLAQLGDEKLVLPLYVRADDTLPLALESGLSAAVSKPVGAYLNATGSLIEEQVIAVLKRNHLSVRTVESCTAGGIAGRLCRVPGASEVVDRAWVTYSNAAKQEEVGVAKTLLEENGAVSEAVVRAMAEGGADNSHVCVAVSGIAGPGGGTIEKPVGTVWIACAVAGQGTYCQCLQLTGSRSEIQSRTVIAALNLLLAEVDKFHRP